MSNRKDDPAKNKKFAPKSNECVYEYFINNYLTPWFHAKTVHAAVYTKASQELDLLKKRMKKKDKKGGSTPEPSEERSSVSQSQTKHERGRAEKPEKMHSASSAHTTQQIKDISTKIRLLEQENSKLHEDLSEAYAQLHDKSLQIRKMKENLKLSIHEANELKMRLSKLAGDKLRENNPDLADLSDPDRPTELGKRFSEIYDNEWSDAFENIAEKSEEQKVRILHELVTISFKYCDEIYRCQVQEIRQILLQVTIENSDEAIKTVKTENIHSTIKELRKRFAPLTAKNVAKKFMEERFEDLLGGFQIVLNAVHDSLRKYVIKCTEICWYMVLCDPSMALSEDIKDMDFNLDLYKPYTKSIKGIQHPIVELHVWPALHLHIGGPLVAKGVAQPGTKGKK